MAWVTVQDMTAGFGEERKLILPLSQEINIQNSLGSLNKLLQGILGFQGLLANNILMS